MNFRFWDSIKINIEVKDWKNLIPALLLFITTIGAGCWWLKEKHKKIVFTAYKKGFVYASDIYEKLFKTQSEEFISKEKDWKENKEEYEELINACIEMIEIMEAKDNKSEDDRNTLVLFKTRKQEMENNRLT